ncbi:ribosome silencing factor [Arhodomonas sp. AD133]|uniref:ribosome silencing factor n=1 Tax=Arhodomonas sp. AD133 TaxID=3415009 RepID=UPI003EBCD8D0
MSEQPMQPEAVRQLVVDAVEDMKAEAVTVLDVRGRTAITDFMVFASGTSRRHLRSIADRVVEFAKAADLQPLGVEGEDSSGWILVDLGDAVVHVMLPEVRDFYRLEHIWAVDDDDEADTAE